MKNLKYFFFLILPLFAFYGCEDDDGSNPSFGSEDVPHIYVNWQETFAYKLGQTMRFEPNVSPSDNATYKWTLNGTVISEDKDLLYPLNELLINAPLKFEVTRNGITNHRQAEVVVVNDFEPKVINKKAIAFLTGNGSVSDIDWQNISHLIISSVVVDVNDAGKWVLDDTHVKELDFNLITTLAHHYGVYVMLEFSGKLSSYMNAVTAYESYTFYNAAISEAEHEALITAIVAKADNLGVDGINIYMDKSTAENFTDPASLKRFYEKLAAAVPDTKTIDGNDYHYLMSMSLYGGWTRGAQAGHVNILRYDWLNLIAFAFENTEPSPHASLWASTNEAELWMGWQGYVAPSRIVLAAPAFGLRYFGKPVEYNWGNLWQFTEYMPYKDICAQYPDAPSTDVIILKENGGDPNVEVNKIYYDGLNSVRQKAEYALSKDIAGVALWSVENDSKIQSQSLMKKINESLGN